uniref:Sodefrin-like factor n=1 Tax=Panagrolaimus sp. JU765 TaxID=591449 RepID=A0AC34QKB1_9BILA
MFGFIIFLTFILGAISQNQMYNCLQCASPELKNRWHLTLLPGTLSDSDFMDNCNTSAAPSVTCDGPCLRYVFEDPDELPRSVPLYVRGCLTRLTLFQNNNNYGANMGNTGRYCEYDESFARVDSSGRKVKTKILVERCTNSTDTCNKDRTPFPPTGGDCADSRVNTTVNNAALNCYECDQINGKCKTGRCSKKYCVKSVAHVQGTWATKKFCSDVNPFGINEVCSSHDLTVSVSNINAIGDIICLAVFALDKGKFGQPVYFEEVLNIFYFQRILIFEMLIIVLLSTLFATIKAVAPGCVVMMCNTDVVAAHSKRVRACDDCQLRGSNLKFCGELPVGFFCFEQIPSQCRPLSNVAAGQVSNFTSICFTNKKIYLPMPIIRQNKSIDVAIPRFFEQEDFEQFQFHSLSLSVMFPLAEGKKCSAGPFTPRPTRNASYCLWSIPMSIPKTDAPEAIGDPFYYDDQTDVSISFTPELFHVKNNSKVAFWYSVYADFITSHQNQQLNFTMPMYSYRKDILL